MYLTKFLKMDLTKEMTKEMTKELTKVMPKEMTKEMKLKKSILLRKTLKSSWITTVCYVRISMTSIL